MEMPRIRYNITPTDASSINNNNIIYCRRSLTDGNLIKM